MRKLIKIAEGRYISADRVVEINVVSGGHSHILVVGCIRVPFASYKEAIDEGERIATEVNLMTQRAVIPVTESDKQAIAAMDEYIDHGKKTFFELP